MEEKDETEKKKRRGRIEENNVEKINKRERERNMCEKE